MNEKPSRIEHVAMRLQQRIWRGDHPWHDLPADIRDHYREMARVALEAHLSFRPDEDGR